MSAEYSPALTLILGGMLLPLLPARLRSAYAVLLPLLGLVQLSLLDPGTRGPVRIPRHGTGAAARRPLEHGVRLDLHDRRRRSRRCTHFTCAARPSRWPDLVYAGAAIGAVFAGDLVTLFVFWELTAVSSVLLVWARGTTASYRAGMRYFLVQLLSGMLLLLGAIAHYRATGSLRFDHIGLDGLAGWLIFLAFGIKCAFPLLHNWLQDAYPEATETGTVFLSAFTTKLAVYALARGFAGTELLIPIGATMAVFPIFYAVIENDLRRVLAYSLNNQLGFMVVGSRHRHRAGAQRHRRARRSPTSSTRRCCSCRWARCCTASARSRAPNSAGCTSRCPGPRRSASSAPHRSPAFRCSAASSASR